MIKQAWQGDGEWGLNNTNESRRSSSEVTSRSRKKLSISHFDADGTNIIIDSADDNDNDEMDDEDGDPDQPHTDVPGAYAVARDDHGSLHRIGYSQGSAPLQDNLGSFDAAECVSISTLPACLPTEDGTDPTSKVYIGESAEYGSAQRTCITRHHTRAVVLVSIIIMSSIVTGAVLAVILSRGPKATDTVFVASSPNVSSTCDSGLLNPFVQCQCNGHIRELSDSVHNIYETLKNTSEFRDHLASNLDIASCDAANVALVWLSQELAKHVLPLEGIRNRFVLALLYASMDGVRWKAQDGWLSDAHECSWEGIGCGSSRNIVSITLRNNRVGGTLPTELGMLQKLRVIDLTNNHISGLLPSEIGTLTALERLYLYHNAISGPIFNLSRLDNLRELNLGRTQLTGMLLVDGLSRLSTLEALDLSFTLAARAKGLLNALTALTNLRSLELRDSVLDGSIPESIGNMTLLEHLSLASCTLTGTIPTSIANLNNLMLLNVGSNLLKGSIPSHLGANTWLRELDVSGNMWLGGTIPSELARCTRLENLRFGSTSVTGTIPIELGNLTSLRGIQISCTKIQDCGSRIALCDLQEKVTIYTRCQEHGPTGCGRFTNCSCCRSDTYHVDGDKNIFAACLC